MGVKFFPPPTPHTQRPFCENVPMNAKKFNVGNQGAIGSFDLVRLSKSKEAVDICPNTLRAYHRDGLQFYRRGKAVFFSKSELEQFIRVQPNAPTSKRPQSSDTSTE